MHKTIKKILSAILTFSLVAGITIVAKPLESQAATSTSWNFKNTSFKNLGTINSTITIDDLTLVATNDLSMKVKSKKATIGDKSYTYALALCGKGDKNGRSVKVPVSGNDTIKVTLSSSSNSSARTLILANESGTQLATMNAGTSASTESFNYVGSDNYIWLYSQNSGIDNFKIQVDSKGNNQTPVKNDDSSSDASSRQDIPEDKSQDNSEPPKAPTEAQNTSDGKVVTSFKELVSAASSAQSSGGGKIYVSGTTIPCDGQLALSSSNANIQIIGLQNNDGTYPVLDFTPFMKSYIGKKSSDSAVGIRISGSKYTIKNLIIEHAPDNGIQIKGGSAGNNTVSNCIVRYNNDAGLQVTAGAYNNNIEYVCSYRNCDVYTRGGNADGFAPKLGAGKGNTFSYCYAWDNSDDGWDSFDKSGEETPDISYKYCAVWNNGNPNVFTGKYDFDKGEKLDENLLLVNLIEAKDPSFASKYNSRNFALPSGNFIATDNGNISLSAWTGDKFGGNPNGFKLGSAKSTSRSTRTLSYCLAFDQSKKAFDNNNSALTASFDHCIAFDNGYNYYIPPFKITGWTNIVGFGGKSADKLPSGYSVTKPSSSDESKIRNTVESTKNSIISSCKKNVIPGNIYFNIF